MLDGLEDSAGRGADDPYGTDGLLLHRVLHGYGSRVVEAPEEEGRVDARPRVFDFRKEAAEADGAARGVAFHDEVREGSGAGGGEGEEAG